jgi:hypothetical protein
VLAPCPASCPQFTAAAQRERQRAGAAEVSSRAVGASVFARRQKAMLTPSGGREPSGGGGAWLQALPRALRWVVGGRRGAEQPPSSELSRRCARDRPHLRVRGGLVQSTESTPMHTLRVGGISCAVAMVDKARAYCALAPISTPRLPPLVSSPSHPHPTVLRGLAPDTSP